MKKIYCLIALVFGLFSSQAQQMIADELLNNAIAYHDPEGTWEKFKGSFMVRMDSPNRSERVSKIELDFPRSFFKLTVETEENSLVSQLDSKGCKLFFNGAENFSEEVAKKNRLTCERASMYKDYYTYLYGLPMKLKNPGTRLDPQVEEREIDGVSYWVLKVTYEPETGGDTWYFYFDQKTYQLNRYQFFHDESKNDGEYIVLKGEIEVNGIKMPKDRSWYYNNDNKYLGTDFLSL